MLELSELLRTFYQVPRAGAARLSDGGGPFGFDIHCALEVDWLIRAFDCDAILETGCHMGDTTEYLARRYPGKQIRTCDIEGAYAKFTMTRLKSTEYARVDHADSASWLRANVSQFLRPFVFLDAHWAQEWPLTSELSSISAGVVCIHDFNIGHPRFSFDTYGGIDCDIDLLRTVLPVGTKVYVNNPEAGYEFPCLQVGRRSGRAYVSLGLDSKYLERCPYLECLHR